MTALEYFEKKHNLPPLTIEQISNHIEVSEAILAGSDGTGSAGRARVICWLHDRLQVAYAAFEAAKDGPKFHRCGWCWRAAGATREAWEALPLVDLDAILDHTQACEHNPLVRRIRELEKLRSQLLRRPLESEVADLRSKIADLKATNADLQGRKIGNADAWAEAASEAIGMYDYQRKLHEAMKATIRSLLSTELPAGELRKAIAELVQ